MNKSKWFLNGGRGSGRTFRLLCEIYENKIADLQHKQKIKIEELEKENAELKEKWLQATDEGTSWAHLKSLERENAELKKQQFSLRNERNAFLAQNEQYEEDLIDSNKNLTKAKELLKQWVQYGHVNELLEQATLSFINSEVDK